MASHPPPDRPAERDAEHTDSHDEWALLLERDEFALLPEHLAELGVAAEPPPVRRVAVPLGDGRSLSALLWGSQDPELAFLHGAGQNAHTWDSVALALGAPLVALDLPGHGHSDSPPRRTFDLDDLVEDAAKALAETTTGAIAMVGMSLGGLVALGIAARRPDLVRRLALVDAIPAMTERKVRDIAYLLRAPERFTTFDDMLAWTATSQPRRSIASLRRGVWHNARRDTDGTWVWRYDRPELDPAVPPDRAVLWDQLSALEVPLLLVRASPPDSAVDDAGEAELLRRQPGARVVHVEAGHSVQSDAPAELASILRRFVTSGAP